MTSFMIISIAVLGFIAVTLSIIVYIFSIDNLYDYLSIHFTHLKLIHIIVLFCPFLNTYLTLKYMAESNNETSIKNYIFKNIKNQFTWN